MRTVPKFSVAIPVYNRSNYRFREIVSCLAQTVSDFEVIASDDCSPEGLGAWWDRLTNASFVTGRNQAWCLRKPSKGSRPFPGLIRHQPSSRWDVAELPGSGRLRTGSAPSCGHGAFRPHFSQERTGERRQFDACDSLRRRHNAAQAAMARRVSPNAAAYFRRTAFERSAHATEIIAERATRIDAA